MAADIFPFVTAFGIDSKKTVVNMAKTKIIKSSRSHFLLLQQHNIKHSYCRHKLYAEISIDNNDNNYDDTQKQSVYIESNNNLDIKKSKQQSSYNNKKNKNNKMIKRDNASKVAPISWHNALAIIPPDDAWDQIQRSRYIANDITYSIWPPAIRLLHPFIPMTVSSSTSSNSKDGNRNMKKDLSQNQNRDIAFDIAAIIEKYNIEPFTITLSEWSIIPNTEQLEVTWLEEKTKQQHQLKALLNTNERMMMDQKQGDRFMNNKGETNKKKDYISFKEAAQKEYEKTQELINNEERIGKEKLSIRLKKLKQKNHEQQEEEQSFDENRQIISDETKVSTSNNLQENDEQNVVIDDDNDDNITTNNDTDTDATFDEFNGPCIVCLEPDIPSQWKLKQLRQLIVADLFHNEYDDKFCSPSSTYIPIDYTKDVGRQQQQQVLETTTTINDDVLTNIEDNNNSVRKEPSKRRKKKIGYILKGYDMYRPVVPIGSFHCVANAIPIARKLRSLWQPITFNVTDLQIISSSLVSSASKSESKQSMTGLASSSSLYSSNNDPNNNSPRQQNQLIEFGCDALIALMGEEVMIDPELNQNDIQNLLQHGEKGGGYHNDDDDDDEEQQQPRSMTPLPRQEARVEQQHQQSFKEIYNGVSTITSKTVNNDVKWKHSDENVLSSSSESSSTSQVSSLFASWLDEDNDDDDDYEEGTVVVIGRTHFFTGEMRKYVGMPAISTKDPNTSRYKSDVNIYQQTQEPID